jgi:hypothetical protein
MHAVLIMGIINEQDVSMLVWQMQQRLKPPFSRNRRLTLRTTYLSSLETPPVRSLANEIVEVGDVRRIHPCSSAEITAVVVMQWYSWTRLQMGAQHG